MPTVRFIKNYSSTTHGHVWIGREEEVSKKEAKNLIEAGVAELKDKNSEAKKPAAKKPKEDTEAKAKK